MSTATKHKSEAEEALAFLEAEVNKRPPGVGADLDEDLHIDFSVVPETQEYSLLPAGNYPCKVEKLEKKISKSGNPYLNVTLTVIDGPFVNRKIFDMVMLDGPGVARFRIFSSALGYYNKEKKEFKGKLRDLIGLRVGVKLVHRQEKDQNGEDITRDRVHFSGYSRVEQPVPVAESTQPPWE